MKPLAIIYWSRVVFGIIAALICVSLNILATIELFTGLALAMLFYILTYYIIYKRLFMAKVEKPTKVLTTGIGAYFFTWIVTWVLFYTFWLSYTGQIPLLS